MQKTTHTHIYIYIYIRCRYVYTILSQDGNVCNTYSNAYNDDIMISFVYMGHIVIDCQLIMGCRAHTQTHVYYIDLYSSPAKKNVFFIESNLYRTIQRLVTHSPSKHIYPLSA